MKANIFFAAIAALAVTSCAIKTEQPETLDEQMTIHASMAEQPSDVKSCVQDGGTQVYWEASDEIKVFFKSSSGRFVSQNTALAAAADFQGSLDMLVGANEGVGTNNALWGLYPYRADAAYDGTSVTTTLPAEQTGRAGSFAKNTHITLACSYSHDLAFYNVCSGLRFSLTQEGIKSITFEGNGGEALAGRIKMAFADGVPAISEVTEPQTVITLTAPAGGTFETGKWYYIEAIPGTLSKGFKMVFNKDGESATLTSKSSVTLRRGKYGSLADADDGLIFKPTGGDGTFGEPVNLGLSVKWAPWNVGASKPEDYGDYFAWGETEPKSDYTWKTYKWCNNSKNKLTKYCTRSLFLDSSAPLDNKTVLDPGDDVARVNWGGSWRIPTEAEWTELINNCTWTWTDDYNGTGIAGRIVTSNKVGYTEKSIFLPAAGYRGGSSTVLVGSYGYYWSSSLTTGTPYFAFYLHFISDDFFRGYTDRQYGLPVRPVID